MFVAYDNYNNSCCAHCGKRCAITTDHFIPKSCRMSVNNELNYVGLCEECNKEKADKIVLPCWYKYLNSKQQLNLNRMMRYARSFILNHTDDAEIIEYVSKL
ncbi:MAG: HNH endonuclease [Lachnospiraceae bacterium]|nr:HNH endonuclease [Lachnospiraceae bacterium]